MMDEGTTRSMHCRSASARPGGSQPEHRLELDVSSVSLEALKENLDSSLDIYADVILNPSFPQADLNG